MKKKLAVCAAVIHTPEILILDEPFSGLDPIGAKLLVDFLVKYQNGQRIIFLSSHDLSYVQKVSTHIGVLENGSILFNGTIDSFTADGKNQLDDSLLKILGSSESQITELTWI
jgi:ABC-2 type transport system ATP-binding protein